MTDLIDDRRPGTSAPPAAANDDATLVALAPIPCMYCKAPIPAEDFTYLSSSNRLLSSACPGCERRVTLTTSTWCRWSGCLRPAVH